MCHPNTHHTMVLFFQCALRLMSDTELNKKHKFFFPFISEQQRRQKATENLRSPSFTSAQRIFYSILYSIFLSPATGLKTVSHPNNSILIFPLNVSFLHHTPIKSVVPKLARMKNSLHLRLLLLSWLHNIFSIGT